VFPTQFVLKCDRNMNRKGRGHSEYQDVEGMTVMMKIAPIDDLSLVDIYILKQQIHMTE
jgi:hypothetical protein